ncbi:WXG100 family type VII secretion target [Arthrobacter sp. RCC_34]|uniref:WXG100 family type VII secretion target n=1 Tax=Arthrobacter sp. RCC_34 TaxID=3239230 RepID=UPI003523852F
MAGFYGADPAQLRALAQSFKRGSTALQFQGKQLNESIMSTQAWKGPDAESFRAEWNSQHRQSLLAASRHLETSSKVLLENAKEQETASDAATGSAGSGPGGNTLLQNFVEMGGILSGGISLGLKIKDLVTVFKNSGAFLSTKKILDFAAGKFSWADDFLNPAAPTGMLAKFGKAGELFGKFGRFLGPALAPLSIYGGIKDMISPEHGGWRGWGDRVSGGLSVVAGGGTLLMAAGLLTNPVGIGIVVGAGVVAGAWALGNMIADSEWGKAAGHWIADRAGDVWNGTKNLASSAWNGAKDVASGAVEGAKKFFSNPVKSLGGLFG